MAQEIYLGPVESGKGVSAIWHTLQHERSLCFDFPSLQTQNYWRLRCDCQEKKEKRVLTRGNGTEDEHRKKKERWEKKSGETQRDKRMEVTNRTT